MSIRPGTLPNTNLIVSAEGYLRVTTPGTYSFVSAVDDQMILYIDGNAIVQLYAAGGGTAMVDSTVTSLPLSAGLHHIAFKAQNGASLAGYRVLYSGPDTLASGAPNGYQALTPSNLYYPTGRPTLANNFHWAGRISNDYTLGDGVSSSVDMLGSPFGAVVTGSFTMGNQAVLNVVNGPLSTLSAGWLGLAGPVSLGNGAVLNTGIVSGTQSAGTLNLIGPVTQSGT
jgi:hypothetical protein